MAMLLWALPLSSLAILLLPAAALALGGGGVGGFGGGGGGGGGSGGGGGGFGGGGFGGGGSGGGEGSLAGVVVLLAFFALYVLLGSLSHWRATRRAEERQPFSPSRVLRHVVLWPIDLVVEWRRLGRRKAIVKLAAAEAAETDPRFAPDVVCEDAARLFCEIQAAWTRDNRARLA